MTHRKGLIKAALFSFCLLPLGLLVWKGFSDQLGSNPVEFVTRYTGEWALRFLVITLSITPARRLFSRPGLIRFRRMLGLFCFFYACIHFGIYIIDQYFSVETIFEDIIKRPYITVGFSCFVLLTSMAITSTNKMIKRLGARRWQKLHNAVYLISIGVVMHFWWSVKSDVAEPLVYGILVFILLGYRIVYRYRTATVAN